MTLIEVLAGLVVLATLLVSVSIARGRFMRQWADADRRQRANQAADRLLASWYAGPTPGVPTNAEGSIEDESAFTWHTRVVRDPSAATLGAVIVRMEITDQRSPANRPPVLSIDLLVHKP